VGRPTEPLITQQATVRAALSIIDAGGISALSLPRLAQALAVSAPSLYHHFANKDEILAAVVREIVQQADVVEPNPREDWIGWFTQLALNLRSSVLRHRNAAPLLLRFTPRDLLTDTYEHAAAYLLECGIPVGLHVQILDGLEKLSIGSILVEAMRPPSRGKVRLGADAPEDHPYLAKASAENTLDAEHMLDRAIRNYLAGVSHLAGVATR
jgi:TetR/AcrR family tetracycline transcriptional repressor